MVSSLADSSINIWIVIIKILGFLAFSLVIGYLLYVFFDKWISKYDIDKRRFVIGAFVICLLLFFGVADITGAFIAGVILSKNKETSYIANRFDIISYMLLSPIFFASIGINMTIPKMSISVVVMTIVLIIVAILTKIIGCGIGAKLCGYSNCEVIQIGIGMISRGEVALIVANKGMKLGIMNSYFLYNTA